MLRLRLFSASGIQKSDKLAMMRHSLTLGALL
jgi:hypothetical protein